MKCTILLNDKVNARGRVPSMPVWGKAPPQVKWVG